MKCIIPALLVIFLQSNCKTAHSVPEPATGGSTQKPNAELAGTYWKLTELNGRQILIDTQYTHEPYMILQLNDSSIKGNGGCNGFGGTFQLKKPNRIKIEGIISTMMACEKIQLENDYFNMLKMADNYYVIADTLILNKAKMAPLARFQAVYMK